MAAGGSQGPAVKSWAQCVEFADVPFGGGTQIGLDDREVGEGAPGAAGGALLDVDRADVASGLVSDEPGRQVRGTALCLLHVNPIKLLVFAAVINGVAAASFLVVVMRISGSRRLMGEA